MSKSLVPHDFEAPLSFLGSGYRLEPLGPQHNERDHEAWMSSIDHIGATPGFPSNGWPEPMSLESNLRDLVSHAKDFSDRTGFTYSILDDDEVIGCIYVYPSRDSDCDASVRSWVRASRADMDIVVWREMSDWLNAAWPFSRIDYDART